MKFGIFCGNIRLLSSIVLKSMIFWQISGLVLVACGFGCIPLHSNGLREARVASMRHGRDGATMLGGERVGNGNRRV